MKIRLAAILLALAAASQYALADCAISESAKHDNLNHAQLAVKHSANAKLATAWATKGGCTITKGWHAGGTIPQGLPGNAEHITVRNQTDSETCHVFDYPDLHGKDYPTTCI
jgi:hypothetical protein